MSDLIELKDKTLIDLLIEEQQTLDTPVGRFADAAENANEGTGSYRSLIPLEAPKAGEQFAFQVDLDRCSGCKGCVTACHSLNGLDENETWRDVGLLVGEGDSGPFQQTVTTACHHCVEPACMIGCPVNAYEKDPVSGVVLHLDDQCIGCQYCVLKCPYDVPKYSAKRGIVRKCDMCHSRLSSGEAPACVQACPHEAIRIVTVDTANTVERSKDEESFLPDSPEPSYTKPTTKYVSKKSLPQSMAAADAHVLRPQHTHWPLVGLLALSQIGVGGLVGVSASWMQMMDGERLVLLGLSWAILHAGLGCSVLHLGQPLKAWRIFLGFKRSWLSREAVILGVCSGAASMALGVAAAGWFGFDPIYEKVSFLMLPLLYSSAGIGLIGVLTSVYIYVDTQRSFWKFPFSAAKFYGSVALGAVAFLMLGSDGNALGLAAAFAGLSVLKLGVEWLAFRDNFQSSGIVRGVLASTWKGRIGVALASCAAALVGSLTGVDVLIYAVLGLLIGGELLERVLYFRAVNAPKMPGGIN